MKLKYDREVDILYIRLSDSPIEESNENHPGRRTAGVVLDYAADGSIVGIEIMNASKRAIQTTKVELEVA